jgi:hypothetical protein
MILGMGHRWMEFQFCYGVETVEIEKLEVLVMGFNKGF